MVGKKKIEALDFKTIEEYFEYIVNSEVNGNIKQAQRLHKELSERQQLEFLSYLQLYLEYSLEQTIQLLNILKP